MIFMSSVSQNNIKKLTRFVPVSICEPVRLFVKT